MTKMTAPVVLVAERNRMVVLPGEERPTLVVAGFPGVPGKAGPTGAGLRLDGSRATYTSLPTTLTPDDAGQAWLTNDDSRVYVWDGSAWPAAGTGAPLFDGQAGAALPAGGNTDDVLTKTGTAAADTAWRAPRIPWASTNW